MIIIFRNDEEFVVIKEYISAIKVNPPTKNEREINFRNSYGNLQNSNLELPKLQPYKERNKMKHSSVIIFEKDIPINKKKVARENGKIYRKQTMNERSPDMKRSLEFSINFFDPTKYSDKGINSKTSSDKKIKK